MTAGRAAARRRLLRRLIAEHEVASQQALVELLAPHGHVVTQATVSRDLAAIGARRATARGGEGYTTGGNGSHRRTSSRLRRMFSEFVTRIDHSMNLVVLHTSPGAAGPVASALDEDPPRGVLGTIAGDDTILVVTEGGRGGARLARWLERETTD